MAIRENFKKQFQSKLEVSNTAPFLFIGSGLSIRYYQIPTWINLLEEFVNKNRDCFKYDFGYYSSKCSGSPMKIASLLADEFHEKWWTLESFSKSRERFKIVASNNTEIALKIELAKFIEKIKERNTDLNNELDLLSKSVISGVLTTNWDDLLETIFKDFVPKIGQAGIIFSEQNSIGEIYKIHGSIETPESMVLTEKDYKHFIDNNHYLNSKLLTFFVDYPIIFMGYSLSDPNIELIFKNIVSCLDNNYVLPEKLKDRLFFIEWKAEKCNPTIQSSTYTLSSVSIPINKIIVHDYIEVLEVLSKIPRKFPVAMLRQLQSMVYDFVVSSESTNRVLVNGLDDLEKIEDLEVVVGFGNISKLMGRGVVGIKNIDLIEDALFSTFSSDNFIDIVQKVLPNMVKTNVFIPFFKYQNLTQNLNEDNSLKDFKGKFKTLNNSQNISIDDYRNKSFLSKSLKSKLESYNNISDLIGDTDAIHAIQRIPYLNQEKIDIVVLEKFLKENFHKAIKNSSQLSYFRKCVCLLDYLKYAK